MYYYSNLDIHGIVIVGRKEKYAILNNGFPDFLKNTTIDKNE